jgi:hypothetical protein
MTTRASANRGLEFTGPAVVVKRQDADAMGDVRVIANELLKRSLGFRVALEILHHIGVFDVDDRVDHAASRLFHGPNDGCEHTVRFPPRQCGARAFCPSVRGGSRVRRQLDRDDVLPAAERVADLLGLLPG